MSTPVRPQVDAVALTAEPAAIRRRVLLRALRSLSGGREVGFDHVDAALEVAAGHRRRLTSPEPAWNFAAENWS